MRKLKTQNAAALAAELSGAQDARHVAKLLRQVALAQIPHAGLVSSGVPEALPGYAYDAVGNHFRRVKAVSDAGGVAVSASLARLAADAFPAIERAGYQTKARRSDDGWRPTVGPYLPAQRAVAVVNSAGSVADRAARVREAMSVETAVLAAVNAKGRWESLPNGNLGGQRAATVLASDYPRQFDSRTAELPPAIWASHPASDNAGVPLVFRREPLLSAVHGGLPVEQVASKNGVVARGIANRKVLLFEDIVFAIDPGQADGLMGDHELLEEIYQAGGEGTSDVVVPAAGFLVVRQDVHIHKSQGVPAG